MRLHGRDRLADAPFERRLGRDGRQVRVDVDRRGDRQPRRLHVMAHVGGGEREAELGVADLVHARRVRVAHEIGGRAEREELHREARERRHRRVLEEPVARPRLAERAPRGGGERVDLGARERRASTPALAAPQIRLHHALVEEEGPPDVARDRRPLDEVAARVARVGVGERPREDLLDVGALARACPGSSRGRRACRRGSPAQGTGSRPVREGTSGRGRRAPRRTEPRRRRRTPSPRAAGRHAARRDRRRAALARRRRRRGVDDDLPAARRAHRAREARAEGAGAGRPQEADQERATMGDLLHGSLRDGCGPEPTAHR